MYLFLRCINNILNARTFIFHYLGKGILVSEKLTVLGAYGNGIKGSGVLECLMDAQLGLTSKEDIATYMHMKVHLLLTSSPGPLLFDSIWKERDQLAVTMQVWNESEFWITWSALFISRIHLAESKQRLVFSFRGMWSIRSSCKEQSIILVVILGFA